MQVDIIGRPEAMGMLLVVFKPETDEDKTKVEVLNCFLGHEGRMYRSFEVQSEKTEVDTKSVHFVFLDEEEWMKYRRREEIIVRGE